MPLPPKGGYRLESCKCDARNEDSMVDLIEHNRFAGQVNVKTRDVVLLVSSVLGLCGTAIVLYRIYTYKLVFMFSSDTWKRTLDLAPDTRQRYRGTTQHRQRCILCVCTVW